MCLSVKQHLTYGASVRPENAVTYSAGNEGQNFVGFSLKPLRFRDPALPPLYGHAYSRPFFHAYFSCTRMRISRVYTRMIHCRGFSTLVLFIYVSATCIPPCSILISSLSPSTSYSHSLYLFPYRHMDCPGHHWRETTCTVWTHPHHDGPEQSCCIWWQ